MDGVLPYIDDKALQECGGSHTLKQSRGDGGKDAATLHSSSSSSNSSSSSSSAETDDEIVIDDWVISCSHGPIATESDMNNLFLNRAVLKTSLPEQLYSQNVLRIRHKKTGVSFEFCAKDALVQWMRDDEAKKNPVVQIGMSERWQQARRGILESVERVTYDWTYTTSYSGTLVDCSPQATRAQMNMHLLTDRRVPILLYDSMPLYVSELDDVGVSEVSVKVRVMPGCWFVLLRFFLRIDMQMVKIRDTRYFCEFADSRPVLRETRHQESHDPATVASCGDADQAASVLQALAPVGVTFYSMEEMVGG